MENCPDHRGPKETVGRVRRTSNLNNRGAPLLITVNRDWIHNTKGRVRGVREKGETTDSKGTFLGGLMSGSIS